MNSLVDIYGSDRGRVLVCLLTHPTESFHLRGLARATNISPTWVSKTIKEFQRIGLVAITKDKEKNEVTIRPLHETSLFKALKRVHMLYELYASGLIDYLAEKYHQPACIVFFGSAARGEDTEESDLDIAVITSRKGIVLSLQSYEKKLHRSITIKELHKETLTKEFKNTLANGIVVSGYLDML